MDASWPVETAVLRWLADREAAMVTLTEELVLVDSGSGNMDGIGEVALRLERFLREQGVSAARIGNGPDEVMLEAGVALGSGCAPVLLMGHMDTVFPVGTAAARPFAVHGDRLYGPGVADMKAGLVMQAFVLAAFARHGAGRYPLRALFTCDEEVASPLSRPHIRKAALDASIALNAEPGRPSGNVVVERKGGLFLRLRFLGKASHSGSDFGTGASAIAEMAHKIVALERVMDLGPGITLNVGLVAGGQSINTVAPSARASVDIRYAQAEQRQALLAAVKDIVHAPDVPGTRAEVEIIGEFHPMVPTSASLALLETYRAAAAELGLSVEGEATGGCSDAGFSASVGTPTLCGVGPVGGNAHTEDEYVEGLSLVLRAQAAALTILRHGTAARASKGACCTATGDPVSPADHGGPPTQQGE